MQPIEHTMLNLALQKMSSVPIASHKFLLSLERQRHMRRYQALTPGQGKYLRSIYTRLVSQGVIESLEVA